MKMFFIISAFLFLVVASFIAWSSYPWGLKKRLLKEEIVNVETSEMMEVDERPAVIKILTFNLGFLYGKGSEGPGYAFRDRTYYEKSLEKLVAEIKEYGADIICFQEIDFESSRSHEINQARFVAEKAGYPYAAEAVSWDAHYIPFPYWPLKNNFGKMKSGGAILSRYPLSDHEVTLLEKPQSNPWWYNLFYLHRYFQKVTVTIADKKYTIINLHLEAFDKVDRKTQIEALVGKIKNEEIHFVAGDFNMLPKSALKKSKFYNDDDYENDPSFEIMMKAGLSEVIPDEIYAKEENLYFTFPAWKPDRRLDFIWYRPELKMMRAEVLFPCPGTECLSDHLPLRASFQIDSPRFNPYSQ